MKTTRQVAEVIEQLRSLLQQEYGYNYEFSISGNGQVIAASSYVRHEVFPETDDEPAVLSPVSASASTPAPAPTLTAPATPSRAPSVLAGNSSTAQQAIAKPEMLLHGRPLYPDSILEWHSLGEWHRVRADSHDANPSMNHLQYIKMFPTVNDEVYRWPDEKKKKP